MNANVSYVSGLLRFYSFIVHIWIIFFGSIFYLSEKYQEKTFVSSYCQINETLIKQYPCSTNISILCQSEYYGINYGNNYFGYFDILPTWFSPIDKQNLRRTNILSVKPLNLSCYYDQLTHHYIRWSKPNPKTSIYSIIIASIVVCLTIIQCLDGSFCSRR